MPHKPPSQFSESGALTPAANATLITPDDDNDLADISRSIYIGGTGDLEVVPADDRGDALVVFSAIPAGSVLPIRVKRIKADNTTATLIVALF